MLLVVYILPAVTHYKETSPSQRLNGVLDPQLPVPWISNISNLRGPPDPWKLVPQDRSMLLVAPRGPWATETYKNSNVFYSKIAKRQKLEQKQGFGFSRPTLFFFEFLPFRDFAIKHNRILILFGCPRPPSGRHPAPPGATRDIDKSRRSNIRGPGDPLRLLIQGTGDWYTRTSDW